MMSVLAFRRFQAAVIGLLAAALVWLSPGMAQAATPDSVFAEPASAEDPFAVSVRRAQAFARNRLAATTSRLSSTAWPHRTGSELRWGTTGSSAWTSGFLPGSLWLAYQ